MNPLQSSVSINHFCHSNVWIYKKTYTPSKYCSRLLSNLLVLNNKEDIIKVVMFSFVCIAINFDVQF